MTSFLDVNVDLRLYAFPKDEIDINPIEDIIQGMPEHLHPTLQNVIRECTTLKDFRRILKNYEKGLEALTSVPRKAEDVSSTKANSGCHERTILPRLRVSVEVCIGSRTALRVTLPPTK
jgi:hypothetical protein